MGGGNGGRGAPTRPVLVHDRGPEGVDSLTYAAGSDTYVIRVGSGLPAAAQAAGARELTVPGALLERLCWLLAVAVDHHDLQIEVASAAAESA